jgi:hypothetical protein
MSINYADADIMIFISRITIKKAQQGYANLQLADILQSL